MFEDPDRIVVGIRPDGDRAPIEELFGPLADRIEWMGVESAELVKHGVNAFLAVSVAFANELATIAEHVGADAAEVERGLKTETRIGPRAYLRPGAAFAGGTLARDVDYLTRIGEREHVPTHLLSAVRTSNDAHRQWARRTVEALAGTSGTLDGHVIGVWGLVYKQGTDTLRRSSAVELCRELARAGATVKAHDAAVRVVPDDLAGVFTLCSTPIEAAEGASAIVVETDWPSYREVDPDSLVAAMRTAIVVDANGFLAETLGNRDGVRYVRVGSRRSVTAALAGRTAIVTGGSHGLGLEIARDVRRRRRSRARLRARRHGPRPRPDRARVGRLGPGLGRDGRDRRLGPGGGRASRRATRSSASRGSTCSSTTPASTGRRASSRRSTGTSGSTPCG